MIIEYRNDKAPRTPADGTRHLRQRSRVTFAEYQGSVAEIEELGGTVQAEEEEVRMRSTTRRSRLHPRDFVAGTTSTRS